MQRASQGLLQIKSFRNNYLALTIAAVLTLSSFCAHAQYDSTKVRQTISAYGYTWKNPAFLSSAIIPKDTPKLAIADSGGIAYKGSQLWMYNGRYWVVASGGLQQAVSAYYNGTRLLTGTVTYSGSGLTFNATDLTYYINNVLGASTAIDLTCDPADVTYTRYDRIVVDTLNNVYIKKGTASSAPYPPPVEWYELELVTITIEANALVPANVSLIPIYLENVEPWTGSSSITGASFTNTTYPFAGAVRVNVPSFVNNEAVVFDAPTGTTIAFSDIEFFMMRLHLGAVFDNNTRLNVAFFLDNQQVGFEKIVTGTHNFNRLDTGWQNIIVDMGLVKYSFSTVFNKIVISTTRANASGFALDNIYLQAGTGTVGPSNGLISLNGRNDPHAVIIKSDVTKFAVDTAYILSGYLHYRINQQDVALKLPSDTTKFDTECFRIVDKATSGSLYDSLYFKPSCLDLRFDSIRNELADSIAQVRSEIAGGGSGISALTGDVTASGTGSVVATLPTVNSNVGTFGSASKTTTQTVNGKGLITAISEQNIAIAESQVTNLVSDLGSKKNSADSVSGVATNYVTQYQRKKTSDSLLAIILTKLSPADTAFLHNKLVSSFAKNGSGDSTILTLFDGTRYAAFDRSGSGSGGGIDSVRLKVGSDTIRQFAPGGVGTFAFRTQRVFNVKDWGAVGDGVTDDRDAIQNAMNAAVDSGGGVVYFPTPSVRYRIAGALVTSGTGAGNPNSLLYIKQRSATAAGGQVTLILRGEGDPNPVYSALATYTSSRRSASLIADPTSVSGTFPSVIGADPGASSYFGLNYGVFVKVEGLDIQVKNRPSSGANMSGINFKLMGNAIVNNSTITVDTALVYSSYPTAETFGVYMPGTNNGGVSQGNNNLIGGFKYGLVVSEHFTGNGNHIATCDYGLSVEKTNHGIHLDHITIQWCRNAISGLVGTLGSSGSNSGKASIAIDALNVEWRVGGSWFDNAYVISDSTNMLYGSVKYTIVESGVGINDTKFNKNGGNNFLGIPVQDGVASLGTNTFRKSGTFSTFFNQLTGSAKTEMVWQKSGVSKFSIGNDITAAGFNDWYLYDHANSRGRIYANGVSGELSLGAVATGLTTAGIVVDSNRNVFFDNSAFKWTASTDLLTTGSGGILTGGVTAATSVFSGYSGFNNANLEINSNTATSTDSRWASLNLVTNQTGTANVVGTIYFANSSLAGTEKRLAWIAGWTDGATNSGKLTFATSNAGTSNVQMTLLKDGKFGIGQTTPTAILHLKAGTATANTAPLKFAAGTIVTTPESGVMETDASNQLYYSTSTTAASRGFINLGQYSSTAVDVTATANMTVIEITAATKTVTLPTAVGIQGRTYTVKLTASGTTGTVATTSSQTIDGSTTYSLSAQYKYVTVMSNNANWIIIANN